MATAMSLPSQDQPQPMPNLAGDSGPPPGPSSSTKSKRANPLIDLIESEKDYVDRLAGVIRKVASAWSKANFPPRELDKMFRAIEAVYKANRTFLSKLKEIGPNPPSPKPLGDLLMQWIDDLETPYTKYSKAYVPGFDHWQPVQSNANLQPLLAALSQNHPPEGEGGWSLDALFALPRIRLRYYKKLYARLLKNTQPERSDYPLLIGANERLDTLIGAVSNRMELDVANLDGSTIPSFPDPPPPAPEQKQSDFAPLPPINRDGGRLSLDGADHAGPRQNARSSDDSAPGEERITSSISGSSRSDRFSNTDTAPTSVSVSAERSPVTMSSGKMQIQEAMTTRPQRTVYALEASLDTSRVLDIFTMRPKPCRLQIANPINPLPFTRSIHFEEDVRLSFVPTATGEEVVWDRTRVVMLTDLFLVCEWIEGGRDGEPTLWLKFPPLAAKHLKVVDEPIGLSEGSAASFQIQVMRKETLVVRASSPAAKVQLVQDFNAAIENAANILPPPPRSPMGGPPNGNFPSHIPPINLPQQGMDPNIAPRSPHPSSVHDGSSSRPGSTDLLSPRSSQGQGLGGFNRMPFGGSDTSLPLSGSDSAPFPPRSASHTGNGSFPPSPQPSLNQRLGPPGVPPSAFPPNRMPPQAAPLHKSPSGRSLGSTRSGVSMYEDPNNLPPLPNMPTGYGGPAFPGSRPFPPPMNMANLSPQQNYSGYSGGPSLYQRSPSQGPPQDELDSPPTSPTEEVNATAITGPTVISAQMKCKVFLKQQHAQWKSLGTAKLKLFQQQAPAPPLKQLVVESDSGKKELLISTIVLSDGVERVGRTGVAIELSDKGARSGIVYMIQLRNESSATGLFDSLLSGSDRTTGGRHGQ